MDRVYARYLGDALLVIGAVSLVLALHNGFFVRSSIVSCPSASKPLIPSIEVFPSVFDVRVYGLHDGCNFAVVSQLGTVGGLSGLLGGIVLGGEFLIRDDSP